MTLSAWITGALAQEVRAELAGELDSILPGTSEQRAQFLAEADQALDVYAKLWQPTAVAAEREEFQLETFANAGQNFEVVFNQLDAGARQRLRIYYWQTTGQLDDRSAGAGLTDIARLAGVAGRAAAAQLKADRDMRKRRARGALEKLVKELATAYAVTFGEQPSAATEGIFARTLELVLDAGDVKDKNLRTAKIGETKLRSILGRTQFNVPRPRAGRKRRA